MAVDREGEFHRWMEQGDNAAWDQRWDQAIQAYTRALQIMPEDPDAHINLGLALLNNGQLDRALKVYTRAHQLSPDDPLPLERSADVLERMGQLREAAKRYVKVSEIYMAQSDLNKAIGNWERATQLTPGLVSIHSRLAQAYERIGDKKRAIREYLTLAYNFRRLNEKQRAISAVERALRLDSKNPHALNALRALKTDGDMVLPVDNEPSRSKKPAQPEPVDPFTATVDQPAAPEQINPMGPMGEALDTSLQLLADHVVSSGLDLSSSFALQALEYQRQELYEEAIAAYSRALEAGMHHPALKMNLGGLMVLAGNPREALAHLGEASQQPELTAGAFHAIGRAHAELGDPLKAARFLTQSLRAVDTALSVDDYEAEDLALLYERLLKALSNRTPETLKIIAQRFLGLLKGEDWKQRVAQTRQHLVEMLRDEDEEQELIDYLMTADSDVLTKAVTAIDRYIERGFYTLAMDEAHRAVEKSPFYLPVHARMAEVMMKEGRIRQAINKFNTVARSYMVRGENQRAATILRNVLEMAPLDIDVRMNLIDLLESENKLEGACDQYIELAATYQQLGDFDQANQTYLAAERIARQIEAPPSKIVEIKHQMADISQMRLNTRQAQKIYEDILTLNPRDEKALQSLVNIYFTHGNQVEAVKRLDQLLGVFAKKNMIGRITQTLEEAVRAYPQDTALRSRLASMYRKLGQKREAIEQLDALGELQLDAGLNSDAANTIRQIISMNPDRVEEYRRLLSQLGG